MHSIGELLRALREKEGLPLRKVAAFLDIDQAILSKIERGQRKLKIDQVKRLSQYFNYSEKEMLITFLSDQILYEIGDEKYAKEALIAAEKKIDYKAFKSLSRNEIIGIITSILRRFPKVSTAWIYGSFSRKDDRPESDIDIAIQTDKGFSYFDLAEIQYHLENDVKREIDIGFIDSFKPHIFSNVQHDLKLIYER